MIKPLNVNRFNQTNQFLMECQNCGGRYNYYYLFSDNESKRPLLFDIDKLKNLPRKCRICSELMEF